MHSFNSTRPNPYAYWYTDWYVGRLHAHDPASSSAADVSSSPSSGSQLLGSSSLGSPSLGSQSPDFQWRTHQRLELLPCSERPRPIFSFGVSWAWRKLLQVLVEELVEEQRVDYLERCWAASDPGMPTRPPIQQFLTLIR